MSNTFICQFCGEEKPWCSRNYDVGLWLAEQASLEVHKHTEEVTPYLICSQCADDVLRED